MYPIMPCSSQSQELVVAENDLKNVACVVFSPREERDTMSVYLIDLAREKLRGFVHLDYTFDLPFEMACVVHKSKLYMFGGNDCSQDTVDMIGSPEAYVLDLSQLASINSCGSDEKQKLMLKRIPYMKAGKKMVAAVEIADKICVFDCILGYKPPDRCFEIFDPELSVWHTVPDPFVFEPLHHFVDGFVVKDKKLFVSIRGNTGVYELNLCANASPTWIHHPVFHGVEFLCVCCRGVQVGSLLFGSNAYAYDLADKRGFDHDVPVYQVGDTANKGYEVCKRLNRTKFNLGGDKICTIGPELLRKPGRVSDDKRKSETKSPRPLGVFPVMRKCGRKKASYRFVVNICNVDRADEKVCFNVLRSFTVPMDYKDKGVNGGWVYAAMLRDQ